MNPIPVFEEREILNANPGKLSNLLTESIPDEYLIDDLEPLRQSVHNEVSRENLLKMIAHYRGSTSLPDAIAGIDMIPARTELTIWCANGHSWKTLAGNIGDWCAICRIQTVLRKFDPVIRCSQEQYSIGQNKFEFICGAGHRFITDERSCKKGCRTCDVLKIARKRHGVDLALTIDTLGLYAHEESRLRFHCNKLRHNPFCQNQKCLDIANMNSDRVCDAECRDYVPCNQDFYATPRLIKYRSEIYCCENDHRWIERKEIIAALRIFEILFNDRFDDEIHVTGVEFSGYNRQLKLAFTHNNDKIPSKCVDIATTWCNKNDVSFVVISRDIVNSPKIATEIMRQLDLLKRIDTTPLTAVNRTRTKMRIMDQNHKLFMDRCNGTD